MKPKPFIGLRIWTASVELTRYPSEEKRLDPEIEEYEQIYPYLESGFAKIKGRYLRFGVCELLAGLIEDFNGRMNLKRDLDNQALTGILIHRLPSTISDQQKIASITQEFLNNVSQRAILEVQQDEKLERSDSQIIPGFHPDDRQAV